MRLTRDTSIDFYLEGNVAFFCHGHWSDIQEWINLCHLGIYMIIYMNYVQKRLKDKSGRLSASRGLYVFQLLLYILLLGFTGNLEAWSSGSSLHGPDYPPIRPQSRECQFLAILGPPGGPLGVGVWMAVSVGVGMSMGVGVKAGSRCSGMLIGGRSI